MSAALTLIIGLIGLGFYLLVLSKEFKPTTKTLVTNNETGESKLVSDGNNAMYTFIIIMSICTIPAIFFISYLDLTTLSLATTNTTYINPYNTTMLEGLTSTGEYVFQWVFNVWMIIMVILGILYLINFFSNLRHTKVKP